MLSSIVGVDADINNSDKKTLTSAGLGSRFSGQVAIRTFGALETSLLSADVTHRAIVTFRRFSVIHLSLGAIHCQETTDTNLYEVFDLNQPGEEKGNVEAPRF